jgi:dolichyl-diphosphooligosaccharide--protein glycosyltransferase
MPYVIADSILTTREIKYLFNLTTRDEPRMEETKKLLSRDSVVGGLKSLGKLRIKVSHTSILAFSALLTILLIAFTIRILPMQWEIQTGSMHLSEFDPYYYFSLTQYMVKNGLISPYWPTQWVDKTRWYPDGINMAMSYPGLSMTQAFLYDIVSALGVNVELMTFAALFPAIMGTLACFLIFFLGRDYGGTTAGLLSALFLALSPSFIQRTSLGFSDDETVGIVALLLFAITFLRAIEHERPIKSTVKYSLAAGLALAYFISSWGASYYPIGLTVLFVFALIVIRRYSSRLLLAYSLTFGLGLFIAINVPYLGTKYLTDTVILSVGGVFVLLVLAEILRSLKLARSKILLGIVLLGSLIGGFALLAQLGFLGAVGAKFISVLDPFARAASPLIESVAEHRISAWGSVYYDLGIGIVFFIVGVYFVLRDLNNRNLFLLLFGLTSLYFASSMVRLLVLMAPAFALLASIGVTGVLKPFVTLLKEPARIVSKKKFGLEHVGKEYSGVGIVLIFILLMTNFAISPQSGGIPKVFNQADVPVTITAASLPIVPNQPVLEWLDMVKYLNNFQNNSIVVASWWDYGYWLTLLGNVTSLADNATINVTQIENVGFMMMANRTQSIEMLRKYNAKYILVFISVVIGQNSSSSQYYTRMGGYGDEGKWMWMARISGGARQRFVDSGIIPENQSWVDEGKFGSYDSSNNWVWNEQGSNSTIYMLMTWAQKVWSNVNGVQTDIEMNGGTIEDPSPYFKEAFFSGLNLSAQAASEKYGGLTPLVCLYEIDYSAVP